MSGYSAVGAKTKAMYGKALTTEDFENLISCKSVPEICAYLKDKTSYGDVFSQISPFDLHRGQIEAKLWLNLEEEYTRIYNFVDASKREMLEYWFKRHDITYLKRHIKKLFNSEITEKSIPDFDDLDNYFLKNTKIDTELVNRAKSLDDYIKACEKTPYVNFLKRVKNIESDYFSIAMGFDIMYYRAYWKKILKLSANEKEAMQRLVGTQIDMLNIIWIYRSKRYFNFSNEIIFTNLLPVRYRLSEKNIKELVGAGDGGEVIKATQNTNYAKYFADMNEEFYIEEIYRRRMQKIASNIFRIYNDTAAGTIAYLDLKEFEILNIIRVTEGIRYGIASDAIRKHITAKSGVK